MEQKGKFPEGFLWGTATAGHQVEGNNTRSDWWKWEKSRSNVEDSGIACDHYRKYKEDLKLAKEVLHNNAYRFSIEWARIEPSEGKFSEKEIDHYRSVLKELKKLKMKSMVTLFHFVSPLWFSEKGGWEKEKNLAYFERFVRKITEELGDSVDYFIVINEPSIYSSMSYFKGMWPPQKRSVGLMLKVYLNLAKAHNLAYKVIHNKLPNSLVGSAIHMSAFKNLGVIDKPFTKISKCFFNNSFLALTKRNNDFIGINYYAMHISKFTDILAKISKRDFKKFYGKEKNALGWPIYPLGIYQVVMETWKKFRLPIIITENGTADAHDPNRVKYLVNHLLWLKEAINSNADVVGYFYWSLMDNFEWHMGKSVRFGLFEVDYQSQKRVPRSVAHKYGEICKTNFVTEELLLE